MLDGLDSWKNFREETMSSGLQTPSSSVVGEPGVRDGPRAGLPFIVVVLR